MASDDSTGDASYVAYLDRRGTNNSGKMLMFGMAGFMKAGIGVVGTSANTNDGCLTFQTIGTNPATYDERMRIHENGDITINKTAQDNDTEGVCFFNGGTTWFTTTEDYPLGLNRTDSTGTIVTFTYDQSTKGTISIDGSNVAYNTSSDYRLKEDLKDFNGLELISKMDVYDFKWKDTSKRQYGVIAHELQEVISYAVAGEKDGEEMQQLDYSKIVPVLLKSIQEQQEIIEDLKKRIETLEG